MLLAAGLAALAAVLPQVVRETSESGEIGRVVVGRALATCGEQACLDEPLEMMTQGRCRHVHVSLDVAGRRALRTALNDEAQDRQPHRVPKGAELGRVPF